MHRSTSTTECKPAPVLTSYPVLTARWRTFDGTDGYCLVLENVTDAPAYVDDVSVYDQDSVRVNPYSEVIKRGASPSISHANLYIGGRERLVLLTGDTVQKVIVAIHYHPVIVAQRHGGWNGDFWVVDVEGNNHSYTVHTTVTADRLLTFR